MWPNLLFHLKPQTLNRFKWFPKKYSQHLSKPWIKHANNSMNSTCWLFGKAIYHYFIYTLRSTIHLHLPKMVPLMEVLCCRPVGATKACVTARPAPMAAILDTAPIGSKGTKRVWRTFVYLKKSISLARQRKDRTQNFLPEKMYGTKTLLQTPGNSVSIPPSVHPPFLVHRETPQNIDIAPVAPEEWWLQVDYFHFWGSQQLFRGKQLNLADLFS